MEHSVAQPPVSVAGRVFLGVVFSQMLSCSALTLAAGRRFRPGAGAAGHAEASEMRRLWE
jgi:hypothetical protein